MKAKLKLCYNSKMMNDKKISADLFHLFHVFVFYFLGKGGRPAADFLSFLLRPNNGVACVSAG